MVWNRNLFLKNIKSLRKFYGLTLAELEERCPSIYGNYIARMNTAGSENRPTIDYVAEIADALDVSIDSLLNIDFTEMREATIFINNFLDVLLASTQKKYSMWEEISLASVMAGKKLNAITVTAQDLKEDSYFTDSYSNVLEDSDKSYIRLFEQDENRPDGLVYNECADGNKITFSSVYYPEQCEFAGSIYKLTSCHNDYFYLIKLLHGKELVYEIYYCNEQEVEGIDDNYFFRFARETDPICNSEVDSVKNKIERLYNLVDAQIHHPLLSEPKRKRIMDLIRF